MTIEFLRECRALQKGRQACFHEPGDFCYCNLEETRLTSFYPGEVCEDVGPDQLQAIDFRVLKYPEEYKILQYP
jgi:hypothetical protein